MNFQNKLKNFSEKLKLDIHKLFYSEDPNNYDFTLNSYTNATTINVQEEKSEKQKELMTK